MEKMRGWKEIGRHGERTGLCNKRGKDVGQKQMEWMPVHQAERHRCKEEEADNRQP